MDWPTKGKPADGSLRLRPVAKADVTVPHVLCMVGLTLLGIFALSLVWEFYAEGLIGPGIGDARGPETARQHWRDIAAILAFTVVAVIVPALVSLRLIRTRDRAEGVVRELETNLEVRVGERTESLRREIDDRIRTEERLRESEERYRRLVELSPEGILVLRRGRIILANATAARCLGAESSDALVGTPVEDFCHPDYLEMSAARRRMVENQGLTLPTMEQVWTRRDGETFVVESAATPVSYQGETVILAVFRDITARKRAEEALRESRRALQAVIDAVPAMVNAKDRHSRYVFMNRYQADLYGVTREEAVGRTASELIGRDYGERTEARDRRVFATGEALPDYEEDWTDAAGRKWVMLTTKVPLRDDTGEVTNVVTVALDVTKRRQAERERRESERWFRAVVDNSPTAIFLKDRDSRYLLVNRTYAAWYKVDPDTIRGKTPHDIFAADLADEIVVNDRYVFESLRVNERELETELRDGTRRTVRVVKFPILNTDGKAIAIGVIQTDITEGRRAEAALRKSEQRLRGAVESLQEGFALFDADDRLVIMNQECQRLNPSSREALERGLRFEDVLRANVERGVILEAIGREEEFIRERVERHRNPKGTIIREFADGSWYLLKEARTPEGGIALTFVEITELKRVEQALRQSEERLRGAVENLQEAFALYDADDRLVLLNDEYRRMQPGAEDILVPGMPFEDLLRENARNRIIATALGREEEHIRERLEHHRNPVGPLIRELTNGTWYIVREGPTPEGGVVVAGTDITDLKRAEDALKGSEERFRNLIEGSIQGVQIHRDFRPLFVNQAFADIFGYGRPAEVVALDSTMELLAFHERGRVRRYYEARMRGEPTPDSYEYQGLRRDGSLIWLENRVSVVSWEDAPAALMTVVDITERKLAEEESRRHQDELAHVWRIGAMGEMATSLAHELNQPISAISTYTQGCVDKLRGGRIEPEELLGVMEEASEQAARAGAILRRIRNFVRKQASEYRPIDLNDAIEDVADLIRVEARGQDVSMQLRLAESLPPVFADAIQIQQVILNLARNGVEAMGGKSPAMRSLVIRTALGDDGTVLVAVQDTGIGVASALLDRVFEPFFTTKTNGLGMGLSISRSIVEAHGGRLWLTSDVRNGTVFQFALPVGEGREGIGDDDVRAHGFHR